MDDNGFLSTDCTPLHKHRKLAHAKGWKPYLMFKKAGEWTSLLITPSLVDQCEGKKINVGKLANSRFKLFWKD